MTGVFATGLAHSASGLALVDRLAVFGLSAPTDPVALTTAQVDSLLSTPVHDGAVCLLGAAIEAGHVVVSAADHQRAQAAWGELLARVVHLDGVLLEAAELLAAAGIPFRVLKGAAVAHLDEVDPAWRAYGDVDLLVPEHSLLDAMDALAAAMILPLVPPVRRGWAARFAKGITLVHRSGTQVDLHRTLAPGRWGDTVQSASLFAAHDAIEVGGVELPTLAGPDRLLHACYHAMLGGVRGARHRRDVLLLTHTVAPADDVLAAAVMWASEPAPEALGDGWASWLACAPQDGPGAVLHDAAASVPFAEQAVGHWRTLRGLRRKAAFVVPLALPSRQHLQARGLTRGQYLRRVLPKATKRGFGG